MFWQVFFSHKKNVQRFPCILLVFKDFFNVQTISAKGSGSGHKGRDPDLNAKCFFINKKLSRGLPAFCGLFKFFQCFSRTISTRESKRESGSRRKFSTSVFLQLKNRAGVFLHLTGFSNFCNVLITPNSLKKWNFDQDKKEQNSTTFSGSLLLSFLAEIREYRH